MQQQVHLSCNNNGPFRWQLHRSAPAEGAFKSQEGGLAITRSLVHWTSSIVSNSSDWYQMGRHIFLHISPRELC